MFSLPEVAVILVIVLVIFGPGKLPSLGSAIGKGLQNLRKAGEEAGSISEEARQIVKSEGVKAERAAEKANFVERSNTQG